MHKALLLLFLLPALCHPSITNLSIGGAIGRSGTADIEILADFTVPAQGPAVLNVSGDADLVSVTDKSGLSVPFRAERIGGNTIITAEVPYDHLTYVLRSDSCTSKNGSLWDFDFSLSSSENVSSFEALISLPSGAMLKSTNGAVTGAGDALAISWKSGAFSNDRRVRLRAGYELQPEQAGLDVQSAGVIAILAFTAIAALIKMRQPPQPGRSVGLPQNPSAPKPAPAPGIESNPVFRALDETDKDIVREMHAQGGKCTQAHLFLNTHIPKATLSRRISSLEARGLIRKSQKGNRNLISLSGALAPGG